MKTGAKPVLFVDLDGTLFAENSFLLFIEELWSLSWSGRREVALAFSRRIALGAYDRCAMKRDLIAFAESLPHETQDRLVTRIWQRLVPATSSDVCAVIEEWREAGAAIVVATAAPALYADRVVSEFGFDDAVATEAGAGKARWRECFGEEKARRCEGWLLRNAAPRSRVGVITDELDDLPLVQISDQAMLVMEDDRFAQALTSDGGLGPGSVIQLDPTVEAPGSGLWLWFNGGHIGPLTQWDARLMLSKHRYALVYQRRSGWRRVRRRNDLAEAAERPSPPPAPQPLKRWSIAIRKHLVRDRLRVFH